MYFWSQIPKLHKMDRTPFVMSGTNFHCGEKANEKSPHRSVQQNRCGDFPSYFLHLTSYSYLAAITLQSTICQSAAR